MARYKKVVPKKHQLAVGELRPTATVRGGRALREVSYSDIEEEYPARERRANRALGVLLIFKKREVCGGEST